MNSRPVLQLLGLTNATTAAARDGTSLSTVLPVAYDVSVLQQPGELLYYRVHTCRYGIL